MKKKGGLSHVEITLGLVLVMSLVAAVVAFTGSHQDIKPKAEVTERF